MFEPSGSTVRAHRGFTLVEVMVVIAITGLLLAILLPAVRGAKDRAASVRCQANLREMYAAQLSYSYENGGRFAAVAAVSNERWENRLGKYLAKSGTAPRDVLDCPAAISRAGTSAAASLRSDYGLNSCLMMPNWRARRDAKMDSARIILMGDKSHQADDFLTTDDGWYLLQPNASRGWWYRYTLHRAASTYRHDKSRAASMVMADGHVETLTAGDLRRDGGRWYWGGIGATPQIELTNEGCCY